ncbi:MAG: hypothetical protein LBQ14_10675 [Treponema sp.]|jgi:hypothetical protein|nr:hypothetical protein [Treponema sp.]
MGNEGFRINAALGAWRIDVTACQGTIEAGMGNFSFTVGSGLNSVRVPMNMSGPCYEIHLPASTGGTATANFSATFGGTGITLTAAPNPGYALKFGTFQYNGNPISTLSYTFTITADVTVVAEFINASPVRNVKAGGSGDGLSRETASGDLQKMMDALAELNASYTGDDPLVVEVAAGTYKPKYKPNSDGTTSSPLSNDKDSAFILRQGYGAVILPPGKI